MCDFIEDPVVREGAKSFGRGTGQGMSIVHTIVTKKHGGEIAIESEVGQGTTITVSLPACEEDAVRMAS